MLFIFLLNKMLAFYFLLLGFLFIVVFFLFLEWIRWLQRAGWQRKWVCELQFENRTQSVFNEILLYFFSIFIN